MVVCNVEIPRPPPLPLSLNPKLASSTSKSSNSEGFRLVDNNQDDTGSIYSIYKQKIDSMFESDSSGGAAKNSVQVRIEKMFTDVAEDDSGVPGNEIGCHTFSVDYMGSVPLEHKVASLAGLQDPLKQLYFAYKRNSKTKKGRLQISPSGLKVQNQGEKGDSEQLNSFPTIAVWSAVKFVLHEEGKSSYAFLPLITDPDNIDKQTLFRTLDDQEHFAGETHSPLFAVVMRNAGNQKQLECHGFICQTSEDAIVIAATLYKSLMAHMKTKDRKPKTKNGITCMSTASSVMNDGSSNSVPVRPPRKNRNSLSSADSDKEQIVSAISSPSSNHVPKKSIKTRRAPPAPPLKADLDAILPYEDIVKEIKPTPLSEKWSTMMSVQQKQITAEIKQVISEGSHRGLLKTQKYNKHGEELLSKPPDMTGDILTKVTIPRSGSFLNAGGLTRYKSKLSRANGQAIGGSPLGFHELFNEFRLQEGLHSVDEILGVIIDPEGMSFNDLKPIYKEFLLKLAMTLTKDELYQRSKAIMRRQKKRLVRGGTNIQIKKRNIIVNRKFKSLKHIFKKTVKVQLSKTLARNQRNKLKDASMKGPESSLSTSSYDTRQFRPKPIMSQTKKQNYRKRPEHKLSRKERASTSEESDFFSLRHESGRHFQLNGNQNRNSSSGYVSCSDCSYDSDTCTCVSADKCYCSLGQKLLQKHRDACIGEKCYCSLPNGESVSWCECDTDSCTDSNKCYCPKGEGETIFEHLNKHPFLSESVTTSRRKQLCKNYSNTKSSKSLEYMHNPAEEYYEKVRAKQLQALAKRNSGAGRPENFDRGLFADKTDFFGKAASECGRRSVYPQAFDYPDKWGGNNRDGRMLRSTSVSERPCDTEALSVKKSAEIAALFADIKLSQTTDITHLIPKNYDKDIKHMYKNLQHRKEDEKSLLPNKSSLYSHKNSGKNKMYSAKNGLYTIQSQSDDSRRSSVCESGKKREGEGNIRMNIGDSLGYLP